MPSKNRSAFVKAGAKYHDFQTVPWVLRDRATKYPNDICLERQVGIGGMWIPITARQFREEVDMLARGLIALDLQPGDRVGIFAPTSYEWSLIDMAAQTAALVVVPIYQSDSVEQVRWILTDAQVNIVFAQNQGMVATTLQAQQLAQDAGEKESLRQVLCLEDDAIDTVLANAQTVPEEVLEARYHALTSTDLATIVYTSGTTGHPKGVMLPHRCLGVGAINAKKALPEIVVNKNSRLLMFLPLAHIMARVIFYDILGGRGRIGHSPDTSRLLADITSFKPSALIVVPRVLEKIYNAAEAKAGKGIKLKIFRWSAHVAAQLSRKKGRPHPLTSVQYFAANKLVLSKLRNTIGPQCNFVVSAGAPLGERMGHFFRGLGMTIVEAYGLTEVTGPASFTRPSEKALGTVGRPYPTVTVSISDEGEVLVKGPMVFDGYLNDPENTKKVIDEEGWFHTGDIGHLDAKGFLTITGRKKELIVTAGGKNVSPSVLEDKLRGHPIISQVVAVGDRQPFISALITLDADMLPGWLKNKDLPAMTVQEATTHPEVVAAMQRAIDRTNTQVSRAESIRKFTILSTDFTEENGMLTPSMKVKREAVLARFEDEIEDMYEGKLDMDTQAKRKKRGLFGRRRKKK
ncbi:MAG: AMP-dependent synthetase/ligase [Actinomycetaceae bacterium]|nr:AMP-dependent synthetase/ligase [Actinomycetaceae bacterium]